MFSISSKHYRRHEFAKTCDQRLYNKVIDTGLLLLLPSTINLRRNIIVDDSEDCSLMIGNTHLVLPAVEHPF